MCISIVKWIYTYILRAAGLKPTQLSNDFVFYVELDNYEFNSSIIVENVINEEKVRLLLSIQVTIIWFCRQYKIIIILIYQFLNNIEFWHFWNNLMKKKN